MVLYHATYACKPQKLVFSLIATQSEFWSSTWIAVSPYKDTSKDLLHQFHLQNISEVN